MSAADLPPLMPGGESTSAQLRRVRQELAEAVSLLAQIGDALSPTGERPEEALGTLVRDVETLVEQRDRANELTDKIAAELRGVTRERDALARRCAVRFEVARDLIRERDRAEAELNRARAQDGWIVARDGGRDCETCEQEITRGQAYEEQPGTGGLLVHFRCRDLPEETPVPATADDGPITPDDEIEIKATTVGTRTFTVDRAEYEQALADDEVDDLFDVYVSDMDEQTTYTTPDGRIHAYPSGEVIGDESDGAF